MKKFLMIILATFLVVGISVSAQTSQTKQAKSDIVELAPSDFKPTFTKETVIKLNEIVSRSLDVINEYDAIVQTVHNTKQAQKTVSTQDSKSEQVKLDLAQISALSLRSKGILDEMIAAEKQLKSSGEEYNKVIFAGMMGFVKDVEREISAKSHSLLGSLQKAS